MSSDLAIALRGIAKRYRLGSAATTLAERFTSRLRRRLAPRELWALDDVTFNVARGDVVGIVGRNGAGKSTLLKILSRITAPTRGEIDIYGRVGSLLEVGTGFHPELTGRENIFLNGAVLGMTRREIRGAFDAIVEFSGVEAFLDTPVKRYSSGMAVRLAFAVAAHLQPEILVVDEVLAVGDAEFQHKCLGKMRDVARNGRTVLFVSHNMAAVRQLCRTGVLLRRGRVARTGTAEEVVHEYLSYLVQGASTALAENPERSGTGEMRLTRARVLGEAGQPTDSLIAGRNATLEFAYENPAGAAMATMFMTIYNQAGIACTQLDTGLYGQEIDGLGPVGVIRCVLPRVPFPLGEYRVAVALNVHGVHADLIPNALVFRVESSEFYPTSRTPPQTYCSVLVAHAWEHQPAAGPRLPADVAAGEAPCGF